MEERRKARVGTVSGLALLAGGTAVAAVAGGAHSIFATILLVLLTLGLGHSLTVEIQRQARRLYGGWSRHDTVNVVLLGAWAEASLIITIIEAGNSLERAVGLALALGYAVGCGYFVNERRRAIRTAEASHPEAELPPHSDGEPPTHTNTNDNRPAKTERQADAEQLSRNEPSPAEQPSRTEQPSRAEQPRRAERPSRTERALLVDEEERAADRRTEPV